MIQGHYKWIQVVNTMIKPSAVAQLIGTTISEDKTDGLDKLILKHKLQLHKDYPWLTDEDILHCWVVFMSADCKMSLEDYSLK